MIEQHGPADDNLSATQSGHALGYGVNVALYPTTQIEGELVRRVFSITLLAAVGLTISVPAAAQAKAAFHATGADDGICKVIVTASWSGARVNQLQFTLTTNAASYTSAPVLVGGPTTVQTSGFAQYMFTVSATDTSGVGRADFVSAKGRVVGSATTDPVQFACT